MGKRSKSREYALLTLFPCLVTDSDSKEIFEFLVEERNPGEEVQEFALTLVNGVLEHVEEIDSLIKNHLKNWDFSRIANLEKTVLRIAVYELKWETTPVSVVLDEAIQLVGQYSQESSIAFVNGVLASTAEEIRGVEDDE
jgi:N utilization substance protein B